MHLPVMLNECVDALAVVPGGSYIDGTLGSGGHAREILRRAGANGRLLGIDRDKEALSRASKRLASVPGERVLVYGEHGRLRQIAVEHGFERVDGIVLDLGVSSNQLGTPERGFSFVSNGLLDMRMDQSQGESARELVARLEEEELARLFRDLGEETSARRIARAIARERRSSAITTTRHLAELVENTVGRRRRGHHPATRVFQALRMRVNGELEQLGSALEGGLHLLRPGGRMAVIAFESLSDRTVKRFFAEHEGRQCALMEGGVRWEGALPPVKRVTRKVARPGEDEVRANPRARSARLRVAERVAAPPA